MVWYGVMWGMGREGRDERGAAAVDLGQDVCRLCSSSAPKVK